jgi:hypothetical protein
MPQVKKHSSTRARANRASTATTMGTTAVRDREIPDLPNHTDWHPAVLEWWQEMWAAPMSDEYHDSDIHQLFVLARLYQDFYNASAVRVRDRLMIAGEIRLQRQSFGLTPYDRRRLEWTIETAEESMDKGRARRSRQVAPPAVADDDPRRGLRTVG